MDHHSLLGFMSLVWIFPSPTWSLKPSTLQKIDYIDEVRRYRSIHVDNEYLERILMPKKMCKSSGKERVFSVTYKTSSPLLKVYKLCGYYSDKPVACDTKITMGYRFTDEQVVLTCHNQPKSFCTPRDLPLQISVRSKNFCELGSIKIKWKKKYPHIFFLNHRLECPRSLISNEKRGTVLSQYEPDWQTSQVFCGITLDVPDSDRIIFCFEFVTYIAGDVLEIKVDDCVMEFGAGHLSNPYGMVCVKRDLMLPVTLRAILQTVQERKHFYLLHYSFEKDILYTKNECPVKKRTIDDDDDDEDDDDDDDDDLEPYQIVLICLGTVGALIIFYKCCCRKGKTLQEELNDNAASSSDLHHRGGPPPRELQPSSAGTSVYLTTTTTTTTTTDCHVDLPSYSSLFPEAE